MTLCNYHTYFAFMPNIFYRLQEREHEVTEQLTSTAASVVALKAQAASATEEAEMLQKNLQLLKQEYRVNALNLEDKVGLNLQGTVS